MHFLDVFLQNAISPPILFFVLGVVAGALKSDLEIPESISTYLSIYLMMAIGFKGGVSMVSANNLGVTEWSLITSGILFSFLFPFVGYFLLRLTSNLDIPTAAAVSAHYGSISIVTFATATAFLKAEGVPYEGYIVAVVALMEAPAIISGLYLAHRDAPETRSHRTEEQRLSKEIFANGAILLLLGSFAIGLLTGQSGLDKLEGFLVSPFQGFLCLFLLSMGLLVSKNAHQIKSFSLPVILFGWYIPLLGGICGSVLSFFVDADLGTSTLFAILCASASYIAVPAAMRLVLPEAKAGIYVPLSIAITFPFNISIGIPIMYKINCMLRF